MTFLDRRLPTMTLMIACLAGSAAGNALGDDSESPASPAQFDFFETRVRPLLAEHCFSCHSNRADKIQAGLLVDSRQALLKGGDSGPGIVPEKPAESLLLSAVRYESFEMPPDRKLSNAQISILSKWIEMGAPWPDSQPTSPSPKEAAQIDWNDIRKHHWAWRPIRRPEIPAVKNEGWSQNPIDRFILAELESSTLSPASPAEPHILARRIHLDLVGIPPTPEQVSRFRESCSTGRRAAIGRLIDELLDSPLYGQRWGRHWLDVARYSDGYGGFLDSSHNDQAWHYRDWVVDAFNRDLPYDEFLRLQIAGDLLGDRDQAVATGFFALGPTYRSDGGDPDSVAQAKSETLDDRVDTLTRGLLGVTVACARCHDHKFDPIPQMDYYSLAGVFNNSTVSESPLVSEEVVTAYHEHHRQIGEIDKQIKELQKQAKTENRELTSDEQQRLNALQSQIKTLRDTAPPKYDFAHTLRDTGNQDMKVAIRGNLRRPGEPAPRRFLRLLAGADPPTFTEGSGRLQLAQAVTNPENPLTARVFVNRMWLHHFGKALVRSPSNFGTLGESPTHPELLDWLAAEFIESGWSIKAFHRLIMTSATYQMSSRMDEDAFAVDGDNERVWRMNPRRLDVESWRDSLLAITGELDPQAGGPPIVDITASNRRTLYAKVSRNGDQFASDEFLRRFDFPLMRATVSKRPASIVPQQYLFLMNSRFMIDRARAFVVRLQHEASTDSDRIARAYALLYSRSPTNEEMELGLTFLSTEIDKNSATDRPTDQPTLSSWVQYAQVLLGSNEFMYVR